MSDNRDRDRSLKAIGNELGKMNANFNTINRNLTKAVAKLEQIVEKLGKENNGSDEAASIRPN